MSLERPQETRVTTRVEGRLVGADTRRAWSEAAEAVGDALGSISDTLRALGDALAGDASDDKTFWVLRAASKFAWTASANACKFFAVFILLISVVAIMDQHNKKLELQIHLERAGEKFKAKKIPTGEIADVFPGISSLDEGVRGLWEQHHAAKRMLAVAQEDHAQLVVDYSERAALLEKEYAERVLRVESLREELERAKAARDDTRGLVDAKLAEMQKNISQSADRATRWKLVLDHNMNIIESANRVVEMKDKHNIPTGE